MPLQIVNLLVSSNGKRFLSLKIVCFSKDFGVSLWVFCVIPRPQPFLQNLMAD